MSERQSGLGSPAALLGFRSAKLSISASGGWLLARDALRAGSWTSQCFAFGGFLLNDSPSSSSRRIAFDRDGESLSTPHRSIAKT